MNKQQHKQYTRYIHPFIMCIPSFNFVGLTVPVKNVTKYSMFENWKEKWISSSLITVYTIHPPIVHVCTKFQLCSQFLWKVWQNLSSESITESQNDGRIRQIQYSPPFSKRGCKVIMTNNDLHCYQFYLCFEIVAPGTFCDRKQIAIMQLSFAEIASHAVRTVKLFQTLNCVILSKLNEPKGMANSVNGDLTVP